MSLIKLLAVVALAAPGIAFAQVGPNPAVNGSLDPTVGRSTDRVTAPDDNAPASTSSTMTRSTMSAGAMSNGSADDAAATGNTSDTATTSTSETKSTKKTGSRHKPR